jgi:hypothetical protein
LEKLNRLEQCKVRISRRLYERYLLMFNGNLIELVCFQPLDICFENRNR